MHIGIALCLSSGTYEIFSDSVSDCLAFSILFEQYEQARSSTCLYLWRYSMYITVHPVLLVFVLSTHLIRESASSVLLLYFFPKFLPFLHAFIMNSFNLVCMPTLCKQAQHTSKLTWWHSFIVSWLIIVVLLYLALV